MRAAENLSSGKLWDPWSVKVRRVLGEDSATWEDLKRLAGAVPLRELAESHIISRAFFKPLLKINFPRVDEQMDEEFLRAAAFRLSIGGVKATQAEPTASAALSSTPAMESTTPPAVPPARNKRVILQAIEELVKDDSINSVPELARRIHCHHGTLYRNPLIKSLIESRNETRKGEMPKGFRSTDGTVEAFSD
jgi:hypothetical protein